ncbi:hypothetical protein AAT19DRAFT_16119, partial [Rhodotorula toruloides]
EEGEDRCERTDARGQMREGGGGLRVGAAESAKSVERVRVERHSTHLLFEIRQAKLLRVIRVRGRVVGRRRLAAVACASEEGSTRGERESMSARTVPVVARLVVAVGVESRRVVTLAVETLQVEALRVVAVLVEAVLARGVVAALATLERTVAVLAVLVEPCADEGNLVVSVLVEAVRVKACWKERAERTTPVASIRSHSVRVVRNARRRELLVERRLLVVARRRLRRRRSWLSGSVVVGDGSRRRRGGRGVGGLSDLLRRDLAVLRDRSSDDEEAGDEGGRESEESEAGRHGDEVEGVGEDEEEGGERWKFFASPSRRLRAQQRRMYPVGAAGV